MTAVLLLYCAHDCYDLAGATDWKMVGRKAGELSKSPNTQWTPVRLAALKDVNVVAVNKGSSSAFCFAVADDGQVRHLFLFLTYCT